MRMAKIDRRSAVILYFLVLAMVLAASYADSKRIKADYLDLQAAPACSISQDLGQNTGVQSVAKP